MKSITCNLKAQTQENKPKNEAIELKVHEWRQRNSTLAALKPRGLKKTTLARMLIHKQLHCTVSEIEKKTKYQSRLETITSDIAEEKEIYLKRLQRVCTFFMYQLIVKHCSQIVFYSPTKSPLHTYANFLISQKNLNSETLR